ncbi:hypothetical protein HDC34_001919 [Pseudoclavibacter sp. JAI123]|uniref:hypothetical protein n=1 Tax=Pseudoclavibacter sp. JAI123 TaxID=2723065 RepID=UPI0015CD9686|nr:hypothetical protein [Pseudoclavibacter sp. JAI123]NYF13625.1 hypothetical protein [Pseudoclavibacter sp. JAI123]
MAAVSLLGTLWLSRQQRVYTTRTWVKEQRREAYREFQAAYSHTLRALDEYHAGKTDAAFRAFVSADERHFLAVADVRVIGSLPAKKLLKIYDSNLRSAFAHAGTEAYPGSKRELSATIAILTIQMWVDLGVYERVSLQREDEIDRRIESNRQAYLDNEETRNGPE